MDAPGLLLIRLAARIVPPDRRGPWRREWEAEAIHAWRRIGSGGSLGARVRLRIRITTCIMDALWERKQAMRTGFVTDLRQAARSLARAKGFTFVAVLTLALGIGADTAVFTLVDGVLFKPLPFPESDRLIRISHMGRDGQDVLPTSEGLYLLYRDQASSLESVALHRPAAVNLAGDGEPERVGGQWVTPSFFDVLRVPPAVGRGFVPQDGQPGAEPVVMLGDGLWRERFGADPGVVGETVLIDGISRRVVGIAAPVTYPEADTRLWLPMPIDEAEASLGAFSADGVARLAPSASLESARTEMAGLIGRLPELFPDRGEVLFLRDVNLQVRAETLKEAIVGDLDRTLWILLGTVGFVLLIACANVANLFLVRAEGRQRELALRRAIGAGWFDVVRPLAAESLVLGAAGGVLGLLVASGAIRVAAAMAPADLPRMSEVGVDVRVMAFTAAVSLVAALLSGLLPALRQDSGHLSEHLKDGAGRGATGGRERHRLRSGLIVAQVALALVLLVGSGLMFRSFQALRSVDPGFDTEGLLTVRLSVPQAEVPGAVETTDLFRQLTDRIARQPGVLSVGTTQGLPLVFRSFGGVDVEDHPIEPGQIPPLTHIRRVGDGYFETMGIEAVRGRTIERGDGADGYRGAVVSQAFAEKWWPAESPLGKRVRLGAFEDWYEVVGVVADIHLTGLDTPPEDAAYFPLLVGTAEEPYPARTVDLVVKVESDPTAFLPVVRREVWALNPRIPLSNPRTMAAIVAGSMSRTSFTVVMLGAASLVALILGMVGIYGVISYVVSQRTREIGVRMALGASAPAVRGMVVRQGLVLAGVGVAVGLAVAGGMSSVMGSLLYGVSATDPLTYGGVAAALTGVALAASWLPAWRASRVHPTEALRAE